MPDRQTIPPLLPPRLRWAALALAVVGWVGMVVLGLRYAGDQTAGPLDQSLINTVRGFADKNWIAHLFVAATNEVIVYPVVGLVALDGLSRRRWEHAAFAALVPGVAIGLTEVVFKPLFHRVHLGALAFPSGHTVSSLSAYAVAALALTAGCRARDRLVASAIWVALTLVVMIGLVGMNYHYPTDGIGGIGLVFGLTLPAALLADHLTDRRMARRRVHPATDDSAKR